jgi:hypothetical protein
MITEEDKKSGIFVLCEPGSITLEIKKPNGAWAKVVQTSSPHPKELSVKELSRHYRPEGIPLEDLIPDSVEEYQAQVLLGAVKIQQHLIEIESELCGVSGIVERHHALTEENDRACAGVN